MTAVNPTILCGGEAMDPSYALLSLDIRREVDRVPQAELRVLDGSAAQRKFAVSDSAFFEPGAQIEIKLREEGQRDQSVFKGVIVRHGVEASPAGSVLIVGCKDAAVGLCAARRSAVFQDKSDDEIIKDIVQQAGLKVGALVQTKPKHKEMVQYRCTAWDFIVSRADALGLLVVVDDGTLSLHKMEIAGQARHRFDFGVSQILSLEIEADSGQQPESLESVGWDAKELRPTAASKAQSASLSPGNLDGAKLGQALGNGAFTLSHAVPLEADELQAWADGRLARSRMALLRGRLAVPGFADIRPMDRMELLGIGARFNGQTVVTGLRHRVDSAGWRTDVQFGLSPEWFAQRPEIQEVPAAGLLPALSALQIGVVADFEDDPAKEQRVKVILPGVDASRNGALWARLATPEAGKERGYLFRPEAGDEVVVGFLNDDPRHPVILGALFGSKNAPPPALGPASAKNEARGIVTKTRSALGFVDGDKVSVFLETAKGNRLLLDDDAESVSLTDQHGNSITLGKDGIVLRSAKAVKIEADTDVVLDSSGSITQKCSKSLTINGEGGVEIKGSKVDIK